MITSCAVQGKGHSSGKDHKDLGTSLRQMVRARTKTVTQVPKTCELELLASPSKQMLFITSLLYTWSVCVSYYI